MTPIVSVTPWRAHMMDTHATAIAAIAANGRRRSVDESNRSRLGVGDRAPVSSLSTSARGVAPYVGLVRRMKATVYGPWPRAGCAHAVGASVRAAWHWCPLEILVPARGC
mmetsp:Transcript_227/g.452  ORF Transcript_227/g.452 Transcript_227/m.452 type:complete len:110 (+) Transcript_227:1503-1832(+)